MSELATIDLAMQGKTLIGYGATYAAAATVRTSNLQIDFFVDDKCPPEGATFLGRPVYPTDKLKSVDEDKAYIVVFAYTPIAVQSIHAKLEAFGYRYLVQWADCSFLHYKTMSARLNAAYGFAGDFELFRRMRMLAVRGGIQHQSGMAGAWLFAELLRNRALKVPGDVSELGAYKGGNALVALLSLGDQLGGRPYHLIDSFEGFPEFSSLDPAMRVGDFQDTSLAAVRTQFADFPGVLIHQGFFSAVFPKLDLKTSCMAYVDCDLYEPALECCEFFYDRTPPGGVLLFHDYTIEGVEVPAWQRAPFGGIRRAVSEFMTGRPEKVVEFPETMHAVVIRS